MFKKITKLLTIISIGLFAILFVACNEDDNNELPEGSTTFTIYALNDFHGMLSESGSYPGISKIGEYLIGNYEQSEDTTLILSAGDMFQGTAVSSLTKGRAVVDAMNAIGFDAMTIGNHEFDWGIEEVLKYQDGSLENGEAEFPFLAANIHNKKTGKLASWAKPYEVIEKAGFKIGVIGVIGVGQESDIFVNYVKDYEFTDEMTAISKYAEILRKDEKCDIVIVSAHNDTEHYNYRLAKLSGDCRVDAILNGHTHQYYQGYETKYRNGYAAVPYVQSGCYGGYIGKITITIDNKTKVTTASTAEVIDARVRCNTESTKIDEVLERYSDYINIEKEILGVSGTTIFKDAGGVWACNVLRDATGSDLGVANTGGIRSNGFPIYQNNHITYGDIFEIMPFENKICTTYLYGSDIINLINKGVYVSDNVDIGNEKINGEFIEYSKKYKVATIDFLFMKSNYPFLNGTDSEFTDILFREALVANVRENVKENGTFLPW